MGGGAIPIAFGGANPVVCHFYIHCIKTPVNKRKSKQDTNLQNPLRTRTKNKRGARKYLLRENTLHHAINIINPEKKGPKKTHKMLKKTLKIK